MVSRLIHGRISGLRGLVLLVVLVMMLLMIICFGLVTSLTSTRAAEK